MLRGLAVNLRSRCQDGVARSFAGASAAAARVAAKQKATIPAEPATVKPYEHHVFVQLPRPADASKDDGPWWPPVIESNPALLGMFSQVAALKHQATGGCCNRRACGLASFQQCTGCIAIMLCCRSCEDYSDGGCETSARSSPSRPCDSHRLPRRSVDTLHVPCSPVKRRAHK